MRVREVVKRLEADGWYELPGKGSGHRQFRHPEKPGKVTVSDHPGDVPPPTLRSIERQSGLKLK